MQPIDKTLKLVKLYKILSIFLNNFPTAGILNPWTGEPIHLSEDQDENSAPDGKSNSQLISLFGVLLNGEVLYILS